MSVSPFVFWAQTEDQISLKIDLKDVKVKAYMNNSQFPENSKQKLKICRIFQLRAMRQSSIFRHLVLVLVVCKSINSLLICLMKSIPIR